MPLLEMLDVLRSRASRRHESAAEAIWAAAKRIAAGESADPASVETAMAETGTTLDSFDELVDLAAKRREWFVTVDRATPARQKLGKVTATAAAEKEAFEETRRRWLERAHALDAEIAVLERTIRAGDEAAAALCLPANLPPASAARVGQALDDQQAAADQVGQIRRALAEQREIRDRRTWMAAQKRESGKYHPLDAEDDDRCAKRAVNRIAELETQLRDAEAAEKAADNVVAKCRAAALKM